MRIWVILGWLLAGLVGMGMLGFELMPAGNRGLWLFLVVMLALGVFLPLWLAIFLGLFTFAVFAIYIGLVSKIGNLGGAQLLALFFLPLAPVWLSALRRSLVQVDDLVSFARSFRHRHASLIDPEHDAMTLHLLRRLFPALAARWRARQIRGQVVVVAIEGDRPARDLLGDDAWRARRMRIIGAIQDTRPGALFFMDDGRPDRFVLLDDEDDTAVPALLAAVEAVPGVKARVRAAHFPDDGEDADHLLRQARGT